MLCGGRGGRAVALALAAVRVRSEFVSAQCGRRLFRGAGVVHELRRPGMGRACYIYSAMRPPRIYRIFAKFLLNVRPFLGLFFLYIGVNIGAAMNGLP